jgi:hypothetical protein
MENKINKEEVRKNAADIGLWDDVIETADAGGHADALGCAG